MLAPSRIRRELDREILAALRQRQERSPQSRRWPPSGLVGALLALFRWAPRL
jgi:hypothetical protein